MRILKTLDNLRTYRSQVNNLAFVPTMGNLHAGHLSLIERAKQEAVSVLVSIFVNPTQFGPNEDFSTYPRTEAEDLALCEAAGVEAVFLPAVETLYPNGPSSESFKVSPPSRLTRLACGADRPGHFEGVCQVVLKLFHLVQPDVAVFGEKDAQQLAIIQAMVQDLALPLSIIPAPTAREADGLAMSSRNRYLDTPEARHAAALVYQTLTGVKALYEQSAGNSLCVEEAYSQVWNRLKPSVPEGVTFDWSYRLAVNKTSFEPEENLTPDSKLLVAARVGGVRLIDNLDIKN